MIKYFFMIVICLNSSFALCEQIYPNPNESKGFHWYNDPIELKENKNDSGKNNNEITLDNAEQKLESLQKDLNKAKALAVLNPTIENMANYKRKQDAVTEMASTFTEQWKKTLLVHPELDYNLRYTHYNSTAKVQQLIDSKNIKKAISELTNKYGLFFFYRGSSEIDNAFAGVVRQFSDEYKISIVAISVDKKLSPFFPLTKADYGISKKLNIKYFPAIMLVEPNTKTIQPLSYGYLSLTDIERRFFNIATNFRPNH